MGVAEGKIKADGTTLGHRAKISWSAHWLGDGARHRPKGGAVPLSCKRQCLRSFSRHYGSFCCVFVLTAYIDADEPG